MIKRLNTVHLLLAVIVVLVGVLLYLIFFRDDSTTVTPVVAKPPIDMTIVDGNPTQEQLEELVKDANRKTWGGTYEELGKKKTVQLVGTNSTFEMQNLHSNTDLAIVAAAAYKLNPYLLPDAESQALPDGTKLSMKSVKETYSGFRFYVSANSNYRFQVEFMRNGEGFTQIVDLSADKH